MSVGFTKGSCKSCFMMENCDEVNRVGHQVPCEYIHTKSVDFLGIRGIRTPWNSDPEFGIPRNSNTLGETSERS